MNQRPLHPLASGSVVAALTACVLLLSIGVARAAEALPRTGSRQTIEMVSANSSPLISMPAGPRLSPADPNSIPAVDCVNHCPPGYEATWKALGPVAGFQEWAQGEYVGRSRLPHVGVYRLRVDDALEFAFRVDRDRIAGQYKINVGDELMIESPTESTLQRTLLVLPDGTISLPMVGQVEAAGRTTAELTNNLEKRFKEYYNEPAISVMPTRVNAKLEELRYAIGGRSGFGSQTFPSPIVPTETVQSAASFDAGQGVPPIAPEKASGSSAVVAERVQGLMRVTPEGTIQLPAIGSVPAQGLTLDEFQMELNERFAEKIEGMEVVPALMQHGPRYVYVLGEVASPGRYELVAPTTVMQAISMAGSWTVGAHITDIVVFRRVDDWRLMATKLDLRAALLGKTPCPEGEIWVGDTDLIIVPKSKILRTDNFIELVFTRGIYGVIPVSGAVNYSLFRNAIPPFLILP